MSQQIKHSFSFLFDAPIWNIVFDSKLPLLAIELRYPESKKVVLKVVDLEGKKLLDAINYFPNWLSSIAAFENGLIVSQKYKDGRFPEPTGWTCFNVVDHNTAAEEPSGSFNFISGNMIVFSKIKFESILVEAFDLSTGKRKKLTKAEEEALTLIKINIGEPQQYLEGNSHFNTVKEFLIKRTGKVPILAAEYMEFNSKIILSYYIRTTGNDKENSVVMEGEDGEGNLKRSIEILSNTHSNLQNFLMVSDLEGNVLMDKCIQREVPGIRTRTFIIKENQLIFISDKNQIHCYVL